VADGLGATLAAIGLLSTTLFVAHIGVQLPGGRLIDRIGARRVALASIVVIAAANALALAGPWLGLALAARAIAGVGTGLCFIAGSEYVRAAGGSSLAQGVYGGVNLGAAGLALAIVPQLDGWLGWRAPFASAVVVAAGSLAALLASPAEPARARAAGASAAAPLAPRGLLRLAAVHTASFGLNVVVSTWVVTLLTRAGDYAQGTAGAVGALTLVAGIVSRPVGGLVARRWPERTRTAVALSLAAGALATALLAWAGPVPVMAVAALVVGLAAGIPFAPAFAAAARARPATPALSVAFVNASGGVLILAATPLVGAAFSLPGEGRIGFLAVAGLWAAALAVLPSREQLGASRAHGSAASSSEVFRQHGRVASGAGDSS
jgi:MFS family permease